MVSVAPSERQRSGTELGAGEDLSPPDPVPRPLYGDGAGRRSLIDSGDCVAPNDCLRTTACDDDGPEGHLSSSLPKENVDTSAGDDEKDHRCFEVCARHPSGDRVET